MGKSTIWAVCGVLVAATLLAFAGEACAGGGYGGASYLYWVAPRAHAWDRDVPYYAAHPPVYYSHIVARPYGYSPHAYYPGIVTPDFELSSPWHPGQPFHPFWDGREWQWRINTPRSIGDQAEEPAPEEPTLAPPVQPTSVRNGHVKGTAFPVPMRVHVLPTPVTVMNPYVVKSSD
ncbi:MAG: hypothetical protein ACYTG0_19595 [Planctomycetota bacterium]|jgi:hypothetical protein